MAERTSKSNTVAIVLQARMENSVLYTGNLMKQIVIKETCWCKMCETNRNGGKYTFVLTINIVVLVFSGVCSPMHDTYGACYWQGRAKEGSNF